MGLTVKVELPAYLGPLPDALVTDAVGAIRTGLAQGVQLVIGALKEASGGGVLKRRSGSLAKSWYGTGVEATGGVHWAAIGNPMVYASIQNTGGTITPQKAKALTIPIAENLTARGVPRYPSVKALKDHFGDRVFTLKRKGRASLIVAQVGKKKIAPYFLLADKAEIPATGYIDKTVEAQADTVRERIATGLFVTVVMAKNAAS